jgi:hypothetical protein
MGMLSRRVLRVFLIPIQSQDPRVTGVQWLIKVNFAFVIKKQGNTDLAVFSSLLSM